VKSFISQILKIKIGKTHGFPVKFPSVFFGFPRGEGRLSELLEAEITTMAMMEVPLISDIGYQ